MDATDEAPHREGEPGQTGLPDWVVASSGVLLLLGLVGALTLLEGPAQAIVVGLDLIVLGLHMLRWNMGWTVVQRVMMPSNSGQARAAARAALVAAGVAALVVGAGAVVAGLIT